ncbi:Manganese transporter [Wickerhamomyces ciferrii]|uniref:Manganese transporter n=1 Tax=Wickerhamomyces ciferrii (strain ATCC 14091 / BCRC 22168 / CBS 111 / JCM 3599 / NBRC 0793 / NRRL Y-1031 F-60-10) TaxID=1206466 RepID=K0KT95_WICCF|nr:Manganese transporter [Wickerhamomyces ciferrii]CCH44523.1 Manganese transporter [Wickerhamomyces ciferrii]
MSQRATSSSREEYLSHDEVLANSMPGGVRAIPKLARAHTKNSNPFEGKTPDVHEITNDLESIKSKGNNGKPSWGKRFTNFFRVQPNDPAIVKVLKKYLRFVGPGLMISVAYMDPGNYATAVSAGAQSQFSLLFIVLLSNIFAIFLQALCIKLGSVTGLDLSRACKEYLPPWLNYIIWFFAECAIIATDVAEVIGTAIALNILLKIPLPAGVVITCLDVLFVLMAYRPGSSLSFVRMFEYAVALLVFCVVICFCVELGLMPSIDARHMFRGFAPSKEMFENNGMYTACSILGATVMPHSLFLGSGLVQPRLREYDVENGYVKLPSDEDSENQEDADDLLFKYRPTLKAIKYAMTYSIVELAITLFTFALFVNSAILIVSGASLFGTEEAYDADLYTIHDLLSKQVAPIAGTIFMIALLFSGQSAGVVCTIAGQIVSEGHIQWKLKPWKRRIVTRSISIVPCLVISLSIGKSGLAAALNASQVVLSILLPFLTAPLIYFTCKKSIMKVEVPIDEDEQVENNFELTSVVANGENSGQLESNVSSSDDNRCTKSVNMANNWITSTISFLIWLFIAVLNVYMIVKLGLSGGEV